MRSLLFALISIGAVSRLAAATIDFTPMESKRQLEGVTFRQVLFHQAGQVISYEPPREWVYSGDTSQLTLTPPKTSQAKASIEQTTLAAPQTFDPATLQQLQQFVLTSLPPEAHNVQLVSVEENPVRINQQPSYEITASYSYFGQDYQLSVIFANLNDLQLRFRFVSRKADFDALHRAFRGSLFSLHWS